MSDDWKVVDGYYPGFRELVGASFKVSVVMQAADVDFHEGLRREEDLQLMAQAPAMKAECERLRAELVTAKSELGVMGACYDTAIAERDEARAELAEMQRAWLFENELRGRLRDEVEGLQAIIDAAPHQIGCGGPYGQRCCCWKNQGEPRDAAGRKV